MSVSEALRRVATMSGWNWSGMRDRMGSLGWSYRDVLAEQLKGSRRCLDVGTGGGEVFSHVARPVDIALDISEEMLTAAGTRLECSLVQGDHGHLCFKDGAFDVVADRHVGATPAEVLRVLQPGGVYVTQRPGGHICQNIFDALDWGSNDEFWRHELGDDYWTVDAVADFYQRAGCRILRREESTVDYEFLDEESLAFWLAHVPLPEKLNPHADRARLDALPLTTNWHAHLLMVEK